MPLRAWRRPGRLGIGVSCAAVMAAAGGTAWGQSLPSLGPHQLVEREEVCRAMALE